MNARFKKWLVILAAFLFVMAIIWLSRGMAASYLHRQGLKAKADWQLQTAIGYFDWAHFISREFDPRFEKGLCLQLRGNFLASQKEFDALLTAPAKDNTKLALLHNAIGINRYSFAEPASAAGSHRLALDLARNAGDRRVEAEALIGLSRVYYHSQGKFADALTNLEQARTIAREILDERIEAAALRNTGTVYWWFKGELDRPLNEFYLPALELYRRQNDQRGEATILTLIALVYNSKGDVYRFMQYQKESIAIQERIGDEAGLSDSHISLGQLYDGIGNYRKAGEFYTKSLELTGRNGYRLADLDLRALMAQVHVNLDEFDEAIEKYDPTQNHRTTDSLDFNVPGVAYAYQLKGDFEQALSLYDRALQAHRRKGTTDVRFETVILLRIAECYISLGDWPHAEDFAIEADRLFRLIDTHSSGDLELAIVRAEIARNKGKHEEALGYLEDAFETESRIFAAASANFLIPPHRRAYDRLFDFLSGYAIPGAQDRFREKANELAFEFNENARYRSLRNFLIRVKEKRPEEPEKSDREIELSARIKYLSQTLAHNKADAAAREQLRKAYSEYEEFTLKTQLHASQYNAIQTGKTASISEVQKNLAVDTVLLDFLFAGEKVSVLVLRKDSLDSVLLPVARSGLAAKVKLFRELIFRGETGADWMPVAESLRSTLIEPVERSGALRGVKRIGIVPRAFLHELPFAALATRENENIRFLIEVYSLFQTPSVTFYTHKKYAESPDQPVTTFGRSEFAAEGLTRLEFAADEAKMVGDMMEGRALINSEATETNLKAIHGNVGYLHFATHAVAENDMPLFSRLLLERSETDDGDLTVREIFELGLNTGLVTLSACETGRSFSASGNDRVEEDRLGLIEAFLHAGSENVLASTFPVSDRSTTYFMKGFYSNLREKDKAEALALAQRAMIRSALSTPGSNFSHPKYWSPFILVGTGR